MKRFCRLLPLFLLFACAPYGGAPHVSVTTDEFSPDYGLEGPHASQITLGASYEWFLLSSVSKVNHSVVHSLFFHSQYTGARERFETASDENAKPLPVLLVNHAGRGCKDYSCTLDESISIVLDGHDLQSHQKTGYRVRVQSRLGSQIILPITPKMIKLQLDAAHTYAHPEH